MTEEEARDKWCPMVRYVSSVDGDILVNRYNNQRTNTDCMGSDCMMWREEIAKIQNAANQEIRIEKIGYCGLAGKVK